VKIKLIIQILYAGIGAISIKKLRVLKLCIFWEFKLNYNYEAFMNFLSKNVL